MKNRRTPHNDDHGRSRAPKRNPNYRSGRTNGPIMRIPQLEIPKINLKPSSYWKSVTNRIKLHIETLRRGIYRSRAEYGRKVADTVTWKLNRANVNLLYLISNIEGFMMSIERYIEPYREKLCSKKELQRISVRNADVHTVYVIDRFGDAHTSGTICISLVDMQIVLTRQEWSDKFLTMYHRLLTPKELCHIDQPSILAALNEFATPHKIFSKLQVHITIQEIERREREICAT